jgi:hypothetical protein
MEFQFRFGAGVLRVMVYVHWLVSEQNRAG